MITRWEDKTTVKKGNIGERIVREFLIRNNFVPYSPEPVGAHPFDNLVASKDKRTIFVAETKTKPARVHYPDTGINESSYNDYCNIRNKYNINTFLFFVDEDRKSVYGNWLTELMKPRQIKLPWRIVDYPFLQYGIIYFPLEAMKQIGNISEEDAIAIANHSTRNQAYSGLIGDIDR